MSPSDARARKAAGDLPLVPPVATWISPGLLSMINHAPTNPVLRGAVRAELGIVLRRDPPLNGTEEIHSFLISKFFTSRPWVGTLKMHWEGGGSTPALPAMYNPPRPPSPGTPGGGPIPTGAIIAEEAPPAIDPDGSFIMRGVRVNGTERGRAVYQTNVFYIGDIRIPADVVREGRAAVEAFLRNSVRELEEDAENFVYGHAEGSPEYERGDSGWEIGSLVLTGVQMDEGLLARARQQLGLPN